MIRGIQVNSSFYFKKKLALYTLIGTFGISSVLTGCSSTAKNMRPATIEKNIKNNATEKDFGFIIDGNNFVKFCIVPKTSQYSKELVDVDTNKAIGYINPQDGNVYDFKDNIKYCNQQLYFFDEISESTKWNLESVKKIENIDVLKNKVYKDVIFDSYSIFKKIDINNGDVSYFVGQKVCDNVFYDYGNNSTLINENFVIEEILLEEDKVSREDLVILSARLRSIDVETIVKTYRGSQSRCFKDYIVLDLSNYEESIEQIVNSHKDEGAGKRLYTLSEEDFDRIVSYDNSNQKLTVNCNDIYYFPETFYTKLNNKIVNDNIVNLEIKDNHKGEEEYVLDYTKVDFVNIQNIYFTDCPYESINGIRNMEIQSAIYTYRKDEIEGQKIKFAPCNAKKVAYTGDNDSIEDFTMYIGDKTDEISITYLNENIQNVRIITTSETSQPLNVILAFNELKEDTNIELPDNVSSLSISVSSITSVNALRNLPDIEEIYIYKKDETEVFHSTSYRSMDDFILAIESRYGLEHVEVDELALSLELEG